MAVAVFLTPAMAIAQTTTLHTFVVTDGANPYSGLVQASDGHFYGATHAGGPGNFGTIFKLTSSGTFTTLHEFTDADGSNPAARLIQASDGKLYGTTIHGGAAGFGTIFRIDLAGTLTTLHEFTNTDGANPGSGLIQATDGNFYGTATNGGAGGNGTVFRMTPGGALTTLHAFSDSDGGLPVAGLIQASDGTFYGTTYIGGANGAGTVFRLASGTLTTVHDFGFDDGAYPVAGLLQGADGSFYGSTTEFGAEGGGTIFKLDGTGTLTTLHAFDGADGGYPEASLIQTGDGSFYGTTYEGGAHFLGTIFKLDAAGVLTTLHSFAGTDGANPYAAVLKANGIYVYGTTLAGGSSNAGVVFRLAIGSGPALVAAAASGVFGGTTTLSATLTVDGAALVGKTVTFRLNGTLVGSASTNSSGVAAVSGVSLAGLGGGAHPNAVQADFAGDGTVPAASATAGLQITPAVPTVTWAAPANIVYGAALGSGQLNATASVAGAFTYTPPAGTVLSSGSHTLSVLFEPTAATDYSSVTAQVTLQVTNQAPVLANPGNQTNADASVSDAEIVRSDAPVAYWRLGETNGASAADSAGTSTGSIVGGVTLGQTGALADGNPAMLLNGSTGYVRAVNGAALPLSGDLTIELWANVSLTARQTLISKNYLNEFELTLETWGQLNFYHGNGTAYEELPLFAGITANGWHHIVVTRDTATKTVRLYVNGVAKGSRTYTGTVAAGTRPVSIGRSDGGSKYVNGRLDEVALYRAVLSAAQAASHYGMRTSSGAATAVSLPLAASDPDGNALAYSVTGLPASLAVNAATGVIAGSLSPTSAGVHQVTATASDGILSNSQTFSWTVTHVNRAPTLASPGNQTNAEGTSPALSLVSSDPEGTPLAFTASGLPASLTINPATGLISGTLPFDSAGTYLVTVRASDGSFAATQTFVWTVTNANRAPVLANPGSRTTRDVSGYAPAVLSDAPLAYWRLGEGSGTTAADTAGTNSGTLYGGVTLGQPGALADGNPAILFNGSNSYVQAANPASSLAGDLSIELWLNVSLAARQTLISKGSRYEFELTLETWGQLNFYQGNGTTTEEIPLSFAGITANSWHHVVLTRTAATKTIRLYVNGVFKGSRTYTTGVAAGPRPVSIARSDAATRYVAGRLDDVALYPAVLSAAQVAAHYDLRTSVDTPTVVALQLSASDPDGDPLTYSAVGLPPPLVVNPATGLITGTLAPTSAGSYSVTATASDGALSSSQTFAWTITTANRAPVLTSPGPQAHTDLAGYAPAVLVDAPVAYWRLGEVAGTTAADSAGTHHGSLFGGVTPGQAGALADGNPAMLFNGSSSYIQAASPAVPLSGDLTIELWLNVSLAARQTLISKSSRSEFELTLETWGQLNFYQGNGTAYEEIPLPFAGITANVWHHVVLTRTTATNTIRLYVNGLLKGSRTYTMAAAPGTRPVSIGRSDAGSRYVNGRLDEVALYAAALDPASIATHYAMRTSQGNGTPVVLQLVASDPDGDGLTYSATGLPASLTVNAATGVISGTISPTSAGTYQVTATVSDGNLTHSQTFTWTVTHRGG